MSTSVEIFRSFEKSHSDEGWTVTEFSMSQTSIDGKVVGSTEPKKLRAKTFKTEIEADREIERLKTFYSKNKSKT